MTIRRVDSLLSSREIMDPQRYSPDPILRTVRIMSKTAHGPGRFCSLLVCLTWPRYILSSRSALIMGRWRRRQRIFISSYSQEIDILHRSVGKRKAKYGASRQLVCGRSRLALWSRRHHVNPLSMACAVFIKDLMCLTFRGLIRTSVHKSFEQ